MAEQMQFPVYGPFATEDSVTDLGLTEEDVAKRTELFGPNKLPEKVRPWHEILLKQFKGPMPGMIMVAITLTVITESWADMGVCAFMLLLNATLGFNEEHHAQAAASKLKDQSKTTVTVFRRPSPAEAPSGSQIPTEELVPGDIVYLKQGSKVPADCQWLYGATALCNEAALTGESVDVPKGGPDSDLVLSAKKSRTLEHTIGVEMDGMTVVGVDEDGAAMAAGVLDGEQRVVSRINGRAVTNPQELGAEFRGARDGPMDVTLSSRQLLGGATIKKCTKCYAQVLKTGQQSMLGEAARRAVQGPTKGEFQIAIERMVKVVIGTTLIIVTLCFIWQVFVKDVSLRLAGLSAIALSIGSVPVALPVVLTVTQALGASMMAKDKAIVTNLRAMQEIAVMQVLCSDKTGTLTTANMVVYDGKIKTSAEASRDEVMLYAVLASDKNNLEDPIDSAVIRRFREVHPDSPEPVNLFDKTVLRDWIVHEFIGFTSETKRVCAYVEHRKTGRKLVIGKGILSKVINTRYVGNELGDAVDDGLQWHCGNATLSELEPHDAELSRHGFKTISVAAAEVTSFQHLKPGASESLEMKFVGILPMQDPPRHDSRDVIRSIREKGVRVKMITGDHRNIAVETARQIALGDDIRDRKALMVPGVKPPEIDFHSVDAADGFAQVLPIDKADIVTCLQAEGCTVGMTGDGANDAAALGAANVGIAVRGAVDAARAASDILLTEGGLSPILTAIVESRKIFQRLRAYVIYRVGHTIHVVLTLTRLILHHNVTIHPMYVIIMALFNDLAITMIGYDNAIPTKNPSVPKIVNMLSLAFVMGLVQSTASCLVFEKGLAWGVITGVRDGMDVVLDQDNEYMQTAMYVQMATTAGLLIFQARTPKFVFLGSRPGLPLVVAVSVPCMLASVMAGTGIFLREAISWHDVGAIWAYNLCTFLVIELCKVTLCHVFPEELPPVVGRLRSADVLDAAQKSGVYARQDSVRGELQRRASGYGATGTSSPLHRATLERGA